MKINIAIITIIITYLFSISLYAEEIGSVNTAFKIFGPNHKIVVEVFEDPDFKNITCYISRAKTGGFTGGLGLAEDTSDAALACQQIGPVEINAKNIQNITHTKIVFRKRTSLVFKKLQVVRFFDHKHNTFIYLSYSDKIVNGSPKNALSAVAIRHY
ncbi:CreA family protein [Pantoea sp. Mhis]|uniref:CreA family protein n=1 Tax=Pantoea sp. Mhis TaxID=2576759 RepID=UPI001356A28D|nr:CreA family protein [Pantoea sp. Mhis]MXP56461.1 hypothetical protein [Pantoea sp. Mhis]